MRLLVIGLGPFSTFFSDNEVLNEEQNKWVMKQTEEVYSLIGETPPDGAAFASSVKEILDREKQWNKWKNEGCPPFNRAVKGEEGKSALKKSELMIHSIDRYY